MEKILTKDRKCKKMARKPRANSHDNTIRNMIIGFCVIILIAGGLLVWNNQSLSYAGTLNGERMPVQHLNFFQNQAWEDLVFFHGWPPGPETEAWAMQFAYESLLELHLTTARAEEFGFSLADVSADEIDARLAVIRMMHERPDVDIFAHMGFSDRGLRRFAHLQGLHDLVRQEIMSRVLIDDADLASALEEHLEANFMQFIDVMVHTIQVETREQADTVLELIEEGADFTDLMREFSITFHEELLPLDEDGQPIFAVNVDFSDLAMWAPEYLELAYEMEIGETSDALSIAGGSWIIFEVADIVEAMDMDDFEENFKIHHENQLRDEYFREILEGWRSAANIAANSRVLPDFAE
jgi:hypothetical protein